MRSRMGEIVHSGADEQRNGEGDGFAADHAEHAEGQRLRVGPRIGPGEGDALRK